MKWIRANYPHLLLAFVLAVLALIVIPLPFSRYLIKLKFTINTNDVVDQIAFADIDGDDFDELLIMGGEDFFNKNTRHGASIREVKEDGMGRSLEQLNVSERFNSPSELFVADFNRNGREEIYIPSVENNTIYLYAWEYPNLKSPFAQTRVDTFVRYDDKADLTIKLECLYDVNKDGFEEVYFSIRNSFPVFPRRIYRWDIAADSIVASPSTAFSQGITSLYKHEGKMLFGGLCGLAGNYKPWMNIPYSDYFGYRYILDEDLNFYLEPKAMQEYPDGVNNFISDGYLFTHVTGEVTKTVPYILKQNLDGKPIDTLFLKQGFTVLAPFNNRLLVAQENTLYELTNRFALKKLLELDFQPRIGNKNEFDLDGNGKPELLVCSFEQGYFSIISDDFNTVSKKNANFYANTTSGTCRVPSGETLFTFYSKDGSLKFYSYAKNPLYPFFSVYIVLIISLSYLLTLIIFRGYRKNLERRQKMETELIALQMLTIKNQVDPHFTLNALNSIDYMYRNNDADRASKYMVKLSRLMHQSLIHSEDFTCSLYDELDFIRTYCELEENRATYPFAFEIIVSENIDPFEITIPRNLLFTYVENAIKHGLRRKQGAGNLNLSINNKSNWTIIDIEDNGIGIAKSQELKTSGTGKGLEIVDQIIKLYKKLTGKAIITNLASNQTGTKITIQIPLK